MCTRTYMYMYMYMGVTEYMFVHVYTCTGVHEDSRHTRIPVNVFILNMYRQYCNEQLDIMYMYILILCFVCVHVCTHGFLGSRFSAPVPVYMDVFVGYL